jgi:cytochrome oxidase assembly protein ShyY1
MRARCVITRWVRLVVVYRFLLSPGWLARLAVTLILAVVMVLLGMWQWQRHEERSAFNARIDAAEVSDPVPLTQVMTAPQPGEAVGGELPIDAEWSKVTVTGRFDPSHEILVRGRTVSGKVGVEVLTPLRLPDGTAVLVDRGWTANVGSATELPDPPDPPTGEVTVVGWLRPSESGGELVEHAGAMTTRRISLPVLTDHLPYPIYGAYLQLAEAPPGSDSELTLMPVRRENAWLNAAYSGQWWIFAGMTLIGFGWLARRHAHESAPDVPGNGKQALTSRT